MSIAWEKVIMWVLVLIVFFVLLGFLFSKLGVTDGTVVSRFFDAIKGTGT